MSKRKSNCKRGSTADFEFGEWPFFDGVLSADAADAARYRYLTRTGRPMDFMVPANESKASCDAAIDGAIEKLKEAT